jgi:isoquinoline 1-oxidoreductase beta subunit
MDELAHEVETDPLDFRLKYLHNSPRFLGVLEELAKQSSWRDPTDSNEAKGMAILRLRDSIVGHVAVLSRKESGSINLDRIIVVVDCGIVINPDIVKQQIEGGTVMGLSSSFKKEITLNEGKVNENNYDSYPIVRYSECPEIETHIISSTENPGGIGEVGMSGVAPAVLNAYFNLTGKRIRKLPFDLYSV